HDADALLSPPSRAAPATAAALSPSDATHDTLPLGQSVAIAAAAAVRETRGCRRRRTCRPCNLVVAQAAVVVSSHSQAAVQQVATSSISTFLKLVRFPRTLGTLQSDSSVEVVELCMELSPTKALCSVGKSSSSSSA
ncbi:unnamed protein product, partial [Urochloa humidicola]